MTCNLKSEDLFFSSCLIHLLVNCENSSYIEWMQNSKLQFLKMAYAILQSKSLVAIVFVYQSSILCSNFHTRTYNRVELV